MKAFYKSIAVIFHPLFMPLFGALIVLYFVSYISFAVHPDIKVFLIILLLVNVVAPAISLGTMISRKMISDIQISNRKERSTPFLLMVFYYSVSLGLLYMKRHDIGIPSEIYSMFLAVVVSLLAALVISRWHKLSIHMMGVCGILGLCVALARKYYFHHSYNEMFWISVLCVVAGLVGSSRLYTKNHTFTEILTGGFVGFILNYLIVYKDIGSLIL